MPTCKGHSRNAGLNLTTASSYVPYFKNDPAHGPYFPDKGLCTLFRLLRLHKNMDFLGKTKKLPILKEVLVMRKTGALFLGEFALRSPFMPLNVLPRGHSAHSNLPSGLGR
jgi:hypothetical protein